MNNRNREQEARERERAQRNRYSTSGYGSDEGDYGYGQQGQDASNLSSGRRDYTGQEQSGQGRGDRDIQGRYSQGGSSAGRQGFQAGARETAQPYYAREGSYPQSQSIPPDDFSQRGEYSGQGQSGGGRQWQSGMQGSQAYGSQTQGSQRGQGSQGYESQRFGSQDLDMPDYGMQRSEYDQRSMSRQQYGYSDRQDRDFGPQQYTRQSYGSGADPNQARTTGLSGQGYGGQDFSGRSSYGSQGALQGWSGQSTDRSTMGHRGKGPKNYSRSDERIREDLNERLTDSDEIDASGISVEVNNGIATLTGTVEQRWMKHLAEDLAEGCSGVRDVSNQITVKSQSWSQGSLGNQSESGKKTSTSSAQRGVGSGSDSSMSGSSTSSGSTGRPGSGSGSTTS